VYKPPPTGWPSRPTSGTSARFGGLG